MLREEKGHMGTASDTAEIQGQIRKVIAELGWSQNQLARIIYTETHEIDDEQEIGRFQEKLKKELQRATTKVETLRTYLSIILSRPEAKKLDFFLSKYCPAGYIGDSLIAGMRKISKELDSLSTEPADSTRSSSRQTPRSKG